MSTKKRKYLHLSPRPITCEGCGELRVFGNECQHCDNPPPPPHLGEAGSLVKSPKHTTNNLIGDDQVARLKRKKPQ